MLTTAYTPGRHVLPFKRSTYYLIAAVLAAVGLAASWINWKLTALGMERAEPDSGALELFKWIAALFIVAELLTFAVPSLLPQTMARLRTVLFGFGTALLVFGVVSMSIAQITVVKSADTLRTANEAYIAQLQDSISRHNATAEVARQNAARQSESRHAWNRQDAAQTTRQLIAAESGIDSKIETLARLQAEQKTTLTEVLGETWMHVYAVVRAVFVATIGIVLLSAGAVILRIAGEAGSTEQERAPAPPPPLYQDDDKVVRMPNVKYSAPLATGVLAGGIAMFQPAPATAAPAVPAAARTSSQEHARRDVPREAQPVVLQEARNAPADVLPEAHPVVLEGAQQAEAGAHPSLPPELQSRPKKRKPKAATALVTVATRGDTGTDGVNATRYNLVKEAVREGRLAPTVSSIQAAVAPHGGIATATARAWQAAMVKEGILVRPGRTYELAPEWAQRLAA